MPAWITNCHHRSNNALKIFNWGKYKIFAKNLILLKIVMDVIRTNILI